MSGPVETVIFRESCYPYSETFVWEQAARLPRSRVVGFRRVTDLPRLDTDVVLGDRQPLRAVAEARLLKLSRRSIWLAAVLSDSRPRTILAHSTYEAWSLLPTARRLGIPVMVAIHGSDVTRTPAAVPRGHHSLRSVNRHFGDLVEQVALFLPASRFLARALASRGVPESKIITHHVGIPIPRDPAPTERSRRVTFVGRLVPGKGLGVLLEAFELLSPRHSDVTLTVVGGGPLSGSLRAQVVRSGLTSRVDFAGQQAPHEVRALMRDSSVVVVPSEVGVDGVREGLGQVALEAQSHGVPVLVSDVGGLPETVPPGGQGIVPAGDVAALADGLNELLTERELSQSLASAGRTWVTRNFDIDHQTKLLRRILDVPA